MLTRDQQIELIQLNQTLFNICIRAIIHPNDQARFEDTWDQTAKLAKAYKQQIKRDKPTFPVNTAMADALKGIKLKS